MAKYDLSRKNRADQDSLNKISRDVDLRLRKLESAGDLVKQAQDDLIELGLTKINTVIAPALAELKGKAHLGALLSTTAELEITMPASGPLSLLVAEVDRNTFAPASFLGFTSQGDPNIAFIGQLVSYDSETGVLVIDAQDSTLTGTETDWNVSLTLPSHLSFDGYTKAETDQHISDVLGDAEVDFDTLGEAEDRVETAEADIVNLEIDVGAFKDGSASIIRPEDDTTWQDALAIMRGAASDGMKMQTLGDGAGGVAGLRFYDTATGETLIEFDAANANVSIKGRLTVDSLMARHIYQAGSFDYATDHTRSTNASEGHMSDYLQITPTRGLDGAKLTELYITSGCWAKCTTTGTDDAVGYLDFTYHRGSDATWYGAPGSIGQYFGAVNFYEATSTGTTYSNLSMNSRLRSIIDHSYVGTWYFRLRGKPIYGSSTLTQLGWSGTYFELDYIP